ncbi:Anthranilate 1,2-dioxygenase ferredoxin subunit [Rubripirellula obstinata]|uniref:Anthranilate 1,2-dioxygenase ferredoxin subunit n=1 Tax=Rubripirellula obstinata TaxID=406547 RepID=A0A5B1CAS5_9BACT|nr:Rieske (2Fe-2S) protein [Rubripirellula obstinata]KAA1257656.1 Anthranilate 1,2-dioxygenase ferredoxin subunit [Rubripirellula obstinata]
MSESWTTVAESVAIDEGKAIEVVASVDGTQQVIAIFRLDGILHAIDGMCAHQGGPIAEGNVQSGCVTCPWHGWQYEVATGIEMIHRKPLQRIFQVRERDGVVQLQTS